MRVTVIFQSLRIIRNIKFQQLVLPFVLLSNWVVEFGWVATSSKILVYSCLRLDWKLTQIIWEMARKIIVRPLCLILGLMFQSTGFNFPEKKIFFSKKQ